jgi:hypothetical protein
MVNAIKFWLHAAEMISEEKGDISTDDFDIRICAI